MKSLILLISLFSIKICVKADNEYLSISNTIENVVFYKDYYFVISNTDNDDMSISSTKISKISASGKEVTIKILNNTKRYKLDDICSKKYIEKFKKDTLSPNQVVYLIRSNKNKSSIAKKRQELKLFCFENINSINIQLKNQYIYLDSNRVNTLIQKKYSNFSRNITINVTELK
ncbi:MAG: hypothetical protein RLZZ175_2280 [Bacteroidota bacterium]|jgi:hypothetical protein